MGREHHFHAEQAGCSVTVVVRLGGTRELELLVDGKEVAHTRIHGHHAETHALTTTLPTDPPRPIEVRVTLPGPLRGDPSSTLLADDTSHPMSPRDIPRRARPTEASWYS
ncbi:hypothetical protein AB0K43_22070 [Kitasatospora sp. NPDC049258]|uniref:hypothetical protein n=1 Tax=Kitasatospora sp. NPDC049258 TaxID=3155394 RepID=UPI003415D468